MIVALFMVLAMSVLGTSLMFVSQTETLSSQNYRFMSQARYGAESGVHKAANHLLNSAAYTPPGTLGDPLGNYNTTVSPVEYNGQPVVLSSDPAVTANYPVAAVRTAFADAARGTLDVGDGSVEYTAHATLKSMRQITDAYSGNLVTIQTWELAGTGTIGGVRAAKVEVAATVERQTTPIYAYAAFATYNGCEALSFAGGATTNSYDSSAPLVGGVPELSPTFGNVGTNGNLTEVGNPTTISGSLSTPRSGVGACAENNVTAQTISGQATVSDGLNQLSQEIQYPTPDIPDALTTSQDFKQNGGCPADVANCAASPNGATITPPSATSTIALGDVSVSANAVLHLNAGIYSVNSFTMEGNSQIVIDSGPVIFKVAGEDVATPITITGHGIINTTFNPQNLQFLYAGEGEVKMAGGDQTSALFYAPNATGSVSGGADLYGAIVVRRLTATGGASIHYDRRLQNSAIAAGNHMMSAFTWKSY